MSYHFESKCVRALSPAEEEIQTRSPQHSGTFRAEIEARRAQDLPDLNDRLIKAGLLEEYLEFRSRYMNWRQGGHTGAYREISEIGTLAERRQWACAHQHDAHQHELWHPTPQKFDFFYTVSYWVAVFSVAGGSFLFFANIVCLLGFDKTLSKDLLAHIRFMGDVCYTATSYLAYFELINVSHGSAVVYLFPAWGPLREKLSPESWIGTLAYFLGMLVWDLGAVCEILPFEVEGVLEIALIDVPCLLGGFAFLIGGICEVLHNRGSARKQLEWRLSVVNCTAGFLCFAGCFLAFIPGTEKICRVCYASCMGLFLVGGIMLMVMWRGNDFGLSLLRQLNDALRAGSFINLHVSNTEGGLQIRHEKSHRSRDPSMENLHESPLRLSRSRTHSNNSLHEPPPSAIVAEATKSKLSTRGVIFLLVYIWLGVCSAMNGAASFYAEEGTGRHFTDAMDSLLWSLVVLIVLTVHSAVTSIPNQQPYRFAMMLVRFTLSIATMAETVSLAMWLPNQRYPLWHSIQAFQEYAE